MLTKSLLRRLLRLMNSQKVVKNINRNITDSSQKRVIICYLAYSDIEDISHVRHSQKFEFLIYIHYFISQGYCVDILPHNYTDENSIGNDYNLVFGFGDSFRNALKKNPNAMSVLLLTETPPEFSLQRETERIEYFFSRKKKKVFLERSGKCFQQNDMNIADYVIYMCDDNLVKEETFFKLSPTGIYNPNFEANYASKETKAFIWFGGPAVIHKGLDICVDIFAKHPEWTLYIAGVCKKDLHRHHINIEYPNMVVTGFVDVFSDEYIDLVNKVSYVILPSCAEATSTAILTSMRHGLIPIVCKGDGFDGYSDLLYLLDDFHIEYVEAKISEIVSKQCEDSIVELSKKIMRFSNEYFTIERFERDVVAIFEKIMRREKEK